ncbi:MerR family transcriptional regulator [Rhodococcus zopfii]|uniref:MerR family transcriptional regulator n=1 Tax=Rhodococcus zopfii TaxID=43772 RepID=UPI000AD26698|nr:MerR family transcriptional regulator [Rhodococcus zopfii]
MHYMKERTMMQIGEVAERAQVSLQTLRHYDEIGLATPSARSEGGFRLYTDRDLERIADIGSLKFLGLPLEQIRRIADALERHRRDGTTGAELIELLAPARDRLATMQDRLDRSRCFLDQF